MMMSSNLPAEAGSVPESAPLTISIPKLAYSEVNLGRVVGQGGFSVVSEVRSVDLNEDINDDPTPSANRQQFADMVRRKDQSYVLKALRTDLSAHDLTKGIEDLAIEADFLRFLDHPNIIRMKAVANTDPMRSRFFLVLERLEKTLDRQFNHWRGIVGENTGYWVPCYGYCCSNTTMLHENWKERLQAACDIASAINYLHHKRIIYRDLKPDNIGFDEVGALRLFDFGLAKNLGSAEKIGDDNYLLTGNTGSLRYMAPEVAQDKPYNLLADSYSFGILFWQICSLTTPYWGFTQNTHSLQVVHKGVRPQLEKSWPKEWTHLMTKAWTPRPQERPTMEQIHGTLEACIQTLLDLPIENRIRAKVKRHEVKAESRVLDVDTRIELTSGNGVMKRHNANIV